MKINKKFYDNVERAVCKYHELYAGAARIARDIVGPCRSDPWSIKNASSFCDKPDTIEKVQNKTKILPLQSNYIQVQFSVCVGFSQNPPSFLGNEYA